MVLDYYIWHYNYKNYFVKLFSLQRRKEPMLTSLNFDLFKYQILIKSNIVIKGILMIS